MTALLYRKVHRLYVPLLSSKALSYTIQIVKDFLYHCFQKDCNLRISAKKLLRHPWMMSAKKQVAARGTAAPGTNGSGGEAAAPRANYNFDEAVQRVQQWNEALKSPSKPTFPKPTRVRSPSPTPKDQNPVVTWKLSSPPTRSRSSSAGMASGLPFIPNLIPLANPVPQLARPAIVPEAEEPTDNWDDDFEEDITLTKLQALEKAIPIPESTLSTKRPAVSQNIFSQKNGPKKKDPPAAVKSSGSDKGTPDGEDVNTRTIRPTPTQSPTLSTKALGGIFKPRPPPLAPSGSKESTPLPAARSSNSSTESSSVASAKQPASTSKEAPSNSKPSQTPMMGSIEDDYEDILGEDDDFFGKVESFKVRSIVSLTR
jgi:serine/threonine protein kinase